MTVGLETFLSPALQPVFDKLFTMGEDLLVKFVGDKKLVRKMKRWQTELRMIEALIVDAEHKQFSDNAVKTWLTELKDLAYDVEDLLGDIALQIQDHDEYCEEQNVDHLASMVETLSILFKPTDQGIEEKIEDISERLRDIQKQTKYLPLLAMDRQRQQTFQTPTLRSQRESSFLASEPTVFGRDEVKQKIITELLRDNDQSNENYAVIPIVGMGGIGKTTLAQNVYNDELLKDHFDLMAWVFVSDVFDVKRILLTIFKASASDRIAADFSTLNEAHTELKQALMNKKFLIVLDDIWSEQYDDLIQLHTIFQQDATGSRVIITTRNENISRMMVNNLVYDTTIRLGSLSGYDCWQLFQQHANDDSDLAEMRDDIVKRCKGLPLAAKALGGLLKTAVDKRQRRLMLESNIWSEESTVLPVLRLSYHHLPSHMKRMFAYCSIFPKGCKFTEKEVILLWMAQGFLPEDQHQSMEDLGHHYFTDLVSRSLLEKIRPYRGGEFIMHDLIHDTAVLAADDICHVTNTMGLTQVSHKRARHVYLTYTATTTLENPFPMAAQLRTFYCERQGIESLEFIQRFRYIHALILASYANMVVPECIGDLKHLRFLSLKSKFIKELPKSINTLWNLQTLIVAKFTQLKKFPNIGSLKKLRHLNIGEVTNSLQEMPEGIEKLTNLRRLGNFFLKDGKGSRITELKNLNHLQGKLNIFGLGNVSTVEDAKEAQLHKKCGVVGVHMHWGKYEEQVDDNTKSVVLKQLKPPTSIKVYNLYEYMGLNFPAWLGDPSFNNIVSITLVDCRKCEQLPALGMLPCLKRLLILSMDSIKRVGVEFYGDVGRSNPFPALELLHFKDMESWEKWEHIPGGNSRAFPCLKNLYIEGCNSLQGDLPPNLPSIKTLEIKNCKEHSVSNSLPRLASPEEDVTVFKCKLLELGTTDDVIQGGRGLSPCELADLTTFIINSCPGVMSLPEDQLLPALKHFAISYCHYTSLQSLRTGECPKLSCFPEGRLAENPEELLILKAKICEGLHRLHPLKCLLLKDLNLALPSSLYTINILGVQTLKNLGVVDGNNLRRLEVGNCRKLESLVGNFTTSLELLSVWSCPKLQSLPPLLPTSIKVLKLCNLGSSTDAIEQIPHPHLYLPSSLNTLTIEGFKNLKTVSCSTFPNLSELWIKYCPMFQSFGDSTLPGHLRQVYITGCELIKLHLQIDPQRGRIWIDGDSYSLC